MKILLSVTRVLFFPWFFLRWTWRKKWTLLKITLFIGIVMGGSLAWMYYLYIIKHPGKALSRDQIMKVFLVETPVYYDDGESLMGVFFESEHRIYINYEDIPKDFVNALIAAEDKNFFSHPGMDPLSVVRAAHVNFRAKKIVQGGSTLTQQTAKNLFKREGRTFQAKFKELLQALKLEAHYSKEEILEFFANQFFVSGTGRGLGIAAKYFFDKPVDQLNLVECAFIAASIRAPNRYNPLSQSTPQKQREAYNSAVQRKNYVARNMLKLKMISEARYGELVRAPIPFKKGRIYHQLNVVMDFIRQRLQSEKFQKIFKEHGIGNIATSGIAIHTTINRDLQEANLRIVRRHLSQIETKLNGYDRETLQSRYDGLETGSKKPEVGQFVIAQVEDVIEDGEDMGLLVKVGDTICRVDKDGLLNLATPLKQFKAGAWASPTPQDIRELVSQIQVGDRVYGYIRDEASGDGTFLLDLEQKPTLQGGLLVTKRGRILSMVGGFENIFFNRAVDAKRQMGSIFKPLVFTAAQQLGWNLMDPLENGRDVFVFQDQFYFPRPDHTSPHDRVSLAWAGVKSENVASIWLLYHLCDKLSFSEFKHIAQLVDLAPREDGKYRDFQRRIRDVWGIIVTEEALRETAFGAAKEEIITDLIFEGRTRESEALDRLKYGRRFDEFRELLLQEKTDLDPQEIEPDQLEEYEIKESFLKRHFLKSISLNSQMQDTWEYLRYYFSYASSDPAIVSPMLADFSIGFKDGREVIAYGEGLSQNGLFPLSYGQAYRFFQNGKEPIGFSRDEILIDGEIRSGTLSSLHESMERELVKLKRRRPYEMAALWQIRDYRVLVGLLYVKKLCELIGIETPLEPVLSFPLGPNAVSILEIAQAYTTLLDGKQYSDQNDFLPRQSIVIDRIVDPQGEEIYHYRPRGTQTLDSRVTTMTSEILKNVVNFGTGIKAKNAVRMELDLGIQDRKMSVTIPTLGKTGTANDYSNSSYIGFVPGFSAEGGTSLSLSDAFVVTAYVGYDDNKPMKNKRLRIFGASGALPIWIDVANAIVNNPLYQQPIDPLDFAFLSKSNLSLIPPPGVTQVPVDAGSGLPLPLDEYLGSPQGGITLYSYGEREESLFKPHRFFAPFVPAAKKRLQDDHVESTGD